MIFVVIAVVAVILFGVLLTSFLAVTAAAAEFTSLASIKRGLRYPTDVAVSGAGQVYVVDGLSKKVVLYNNGYQYTGAISLLANPVAVAVSGSGAVYVADNTSKTVSILDAAGNLTGELQKGGTAATFRLPRNIAS